MFSPNAFANLPISLLDVSSKIQDENSKLKVLELSLLWIPFA